MVLSTAAGFKKDSFRSCTVSGTCDDRTFCPFQKPLAQILFWVEAVLLACFANNRTWPRSSAGWRNNHGWSIRIPETHINGPEFFLV
jgi:hypothetical protein